MQYNPRFIPELGTVEELRQWLNEELKTLSQSLNETTELDLRNSRHAPDRPREGMIIHADGTTWDPGSGAGTYRYQGGVWVKIPSPIDIPTITRPITLVGDANYTILAADRNVFTNVAFTAPRTWTLPAASSVQPHEEILIFDRKLALTLTNNLTVQRSGSDTIDDVLTSVTFPGTGVGMRFVSDGVSKWAGIWEFVSTSTMLDNISSTRGSLLSRQSAGWLGLAPGTATQVLTSNGAGADPSYQAIPASGGLTLVASGSFPAAATWSFTGLSGYKFFMVSFRGVGQASGTSRVLQVALSGNNGSSYGTPRQPNGGTAFATGASTHFQFWITRVDQTNNQVCFITSFVSGSTVLEDSSSLGPVNALQFSWSGAATNFTSGGVDIYGLK